MKTVLVSVSALALGAAAAHAGGVERSTQSVGILFEKGTYVEFSLGSVSPHVSGTQATPIYAPPPAPAGTIAVPAGSSTGNMTDSYVTYSLGFKTALSKNVDVALVLDEPIGADVTYPSGTGYAYAGSTGKISSKAVTAMLRYKLPSNVSLYGGIRGETASGSVSIPLLSNYTMSTNDSTEFGYLVGVAYEKPEIALRVALTYNSEIKHTFDVSENGGPSLPFSTTVPQSVNLEFQTGVAPKTLVFGSVRWREWKAFDITPVGYNMATGGSLVSYDNNTITYTLGIGRKFNEHWSGAVQLGYEKSNGGFAGNLGPTDGYTSVGAGVTYTQDKVKVTMGVSYVMIGDAQTENPSLPGTALSNFTNNHATAFGIKVGYNF
ncbi:hypothetical protein [Acidimangrovimonas pyrenivorans]|uniref:Long-chain fatty acid transport protein n=1 Tax=Acidimangrovimonas pyrenivorans TaxID=2030798 RepID=A0ABV7AEA7_9RHOB